MTERWNANERYHPLPDALAVAVQLEMWKLADLDDEQRAERIAHHTRPEVADLIGGSGDQLLYGGDECVPTFAAVARGLAAMAYAPGGVTLFGAHWCTDHDVCRRAEAAARTGER